MRRHLAYCTNVHAGSDLDALTANLSRHSLAVKARFAPDRPMGVGLWVAAPAAKKLLDPPRLADLSRFLAQRGLIPFTLNGFPFGDFHEPVVKQRVYHPTWFEAPRLHYTLDLVTILHAILPAGLEGSISTLPIAWRSPRPSDEQLRTAARQLAEVARRLLQLEADTGRLIYVCLEPEPGCYLQHSGDVLPFFQHYLCQQGDEAQLRRYIRVCHDVCHSAVMFEDQAEVLQQYARQGIRVGKVQISSAVEVDFQQAGPAQHARLIQQLASFAEDRYLHQTAMLLPDGRPPLFFDDLTEALAHAEHHKEYLQGIWRVHFHVPIYLERFGAIQTTRSHVRQCLEAVHTQPELTHFEVETYAWGVLPAPLQHQELSDGIAQEMQWLVQQPEWTLDEQPERD